MSTITNLEKWELLSELNTAARKRGLTAEERKGESITLMHGHSGKVFAWINGGVQLTYKMKVETMHDLLLRMPKI